LNEVDIRNVPEHIAIIMDGNRRWAKLNGKSKNTGHREGMLRLKEIVESCGELGVKALTVYAFSTENWAREKEEVMYLMNLVLEFSNTMILPLHKAGVKINVFGDIERFPENSQKGIQDAVERTKHNKNLVLNIALGYGGRDEITKAVRTIGKQLILGELAVDEIDESKFSDFLYSKGQRDPDLLIRTSGEQRLSNFLLYQLAYTEFYFTEVLWPDFSKEKLHQAIAEYQRRKRRFGKE